MTAVVWLPSSISAPSGASRRHQLEFDSDFCVHCGLAWCDIVNWRMECTVLRWPDGTPVKERIDG